MDSASATSASARSTRTRIASSNRLRWIAPSPITPRGRIPPGPSSTPSSASRESDTVVVHSMDRLARNLDDLRRIVRALADRGIRVEFVKEGLTFTGEDAPMATLLLSVMGAFAEFERALIRERQREGVALAKQRGAYRGRKRA